MRTSLILLVAAVALADFAATDPPAGRTVQRYLRLGVEHILSGPDHLLFVLMLLLAVRRTWRLVGAVTAFTVAHSVTLALAALGHLSLEPRAVEACIALSIVLRSSRTLPGQL